MKTSRFVLLRSNPLGSASLRAPSALAAALTLVACKKDAELTSAADVPQYVPIVEKRLPDGMLLVEVDRNLDKQPDVFNYYEELESKNRRMVRKEVDVDVDGRIDVVTYFTDDGDIEREEMDRDFDGRFDWIDHYQDAVRVMTEVDSDSDGKMDVFSYYEGSPPKISRKERDTNSDGRIDTWERFDPNGVVTRTGRDIDGDGKMDIRDE